MAQEAPPEPAWPAVIAQLTTQQNAIRDGLANLVHASTRVAAARANPNPASFVKPPRYDGQIDGITWSTFRAQFASYARLRWGNPDDLNEDQIDQQKQICYLSISKTAARLLTGLGPTSAAFIAAGSLEAYLALLTGVFRPTSEVNLARQRFRQRKQDPKESIQVYANAKEELYDAGYGEEYARGDHEILVSEFIDGVFNRAVFEALSNNTPYANMQACVNAALKIVATQRSSVRQGRRKDEGGLVTSIFQVDSDNLRFGGATSSTTAARNDVPVPMEIGQLGQVGGGADFYEDDSSYGGDQGEVDYGYWGEEVAAIMEDEEVCVALLSEHLGALSTNGFQGTCFDCNTFGHSARYCPTPTRRRGGRGRRGWGGGRFQRGRGRGRFIGRGRGFGRGTSLPNRNPSNGRFASTTGYKPNIGHMEGDEGEEQQEDAAAAAVRGEVEEEHADGLN